MEKFKAWIHLSRPPFHLVGILPFILGAFIVWRIYGIFHMPIMLLSVVAVILIMLSTYYLGEYYDIREDKLSAEKERNIFSGGTQIMVKKLLPREYAKTAGFIALLAAGIIGIVLQFYYKTGVWTIPLGLLGMGCGFFYSTPPFRWVKRGIGEIMIGFCYGWLPVATAFYLFVGGIENIIHWISVPISLTIFNVILINEFSDYSADIIVSKKNLVVRFGKEVSAIIYMIAAIASWIAFVLSVKQGLPFLIYLFYAPFFLISLVLVLLMFKKSYLNTKRLELMCGLTIFVNLGTTLAYILAFSFGSFKIQ